MNVREVNKRVREALRELLGTSDRFRAWLTIQDPKFEFFSGSTCGCPLRVFVFVQLRNLYRINLSSLSVFSDRIKWSAFDNSAVAQEFLPEWAEAFSILDSDMKVKGITRITKIKALDMLDQVLEEIV